MVYLDIVLNVPVNQSFTYSYSQDTVQTGMRAEVMFGNRRMTGFITGVHAELPPACPVESGKIRPVNKLLDDEPLLAKSCSLLPAGCPVITCAPWVKQFQQ